MTGIIRPGRSLRRMNSIFNKKTEAAMVALHVNAEVSSGINSLPSSAHGRHTQEQRRYNAVNKCLVQPRNISLHATALLVPAFWGQPQLPFSGCHSEVRFSFTCYYSLIRTSELYNIFTIAVRKSTIRFNDFKYLRFDMLCSDHF